MTQPGPPSGVEALRAARQAVLERIAAACVRTGRAPAEVELVAVSKTVAADRLRDAVAAGLTVLGENRVQEAETKAPDVPGATWQLVGPLQSNKARRALEVFTVIQSVDTVGLAERLDRLAREMGGGSGQGGPGRRYPVLLQVNVDGDPAKAGFAPADLPAALERLTGLDGLDLRGLMTIGRFVTDPQAARPTFAALRGLSERLRASSGLGAELSMGMTDDYEVAVEEGATIVRVGRALFGERPHQHGDGEVEHRH
jgi:pyridoxal phosphate enzyme (YggS family)